MSKSKHPILRALLEGDTMLDYTTTTTANTNAATTTLNYTSYTALQYPTPHCTALYYYNYGILQCASQIAIHYLHYIPLITLH